MTIIRNATSKDFSAIVGLADEALGDGYFEPSQQGLLIVAERAGNIAGFCYGDLFSLIDLHEKVLKGRVAPSFGVGVENIKVGVIQTIAVKEGFQRLGIGLMLAEAMICSFGEPPVILSPAWRQPCGAVNASRILLKVGMKELACYPKFWTEESMQLGYSCSICGNPCQCEMVLFGMC